MTYLLDTNACIALMEEKPASVRVHFRKAVETRARIAISSIVAFELWYGVSKSQRQQFNTSRLQTLLSGELEIAPFDDADAQTAGQVRAELERRGTPIGAYDLLIAAQALRRGCTVVTANASEFRRVTGLTWVDWASIV